VARTAWKEKFFDERARFAEYRKTNWLNPDGPLVFDPERGWEWRVHEDGSLLVYRVPKPEEVV